MSKIANVLEKIYNLEKKKFKVAFSQSYKMTIDDAWQMFSEAQSKTNPS